ncbi:MAG: aspartate--tRNA(Asn) ligase [Nitrosopumilus sp.]|nr:aspartate--tRNA(Asn) ligase [Nitrosopumilus sp.]
MIKEQDLENWRRTHYSFQINSSQINQSIIIMGWISSKRDHGNVLFIQIRDKFGDIQVVVKKKGENDSTNEIFEILKNLKEHSSIGIKGIVVEQKRSSNGVEVIPNEIKVLSVSNKSAPFLTQAVSTIGIDTRLELRALDLRRNYLQNIFKIRFTILNSIREFLTQNYFIEVNTPKMIATATEGGAALFPIFYYDREAFLAQSPQLYKEQLTMAFENVFEIAPIFRAEPSRTNRHLSEAISIDVEKAFVNYNDIMNLLDELISFIISKISEKNQDELKNLDLELPDIKIPFPRYTYSELIDKLHKSHKYIRWGDDISPKILKDIIDDTFYYIVDWPLSIKPFYVKPKINNNVTILNNESFNSNEDGYERGNDNSKMVSESFDLMYGILELSSGSTRINNKNIILNQMKKKGLNPAAFDYHLRIFDYGIPPHAGFGLGLERLIMALLKVENIRDATLYPRDIDRLTP